MDAEQIRQLEPKLGGFGDGTRIVRRAAIDGAAPRPWNSPPLGGRQLPSRLPRPSRGEARRWRRFDSRSR